MMWEVPLKEKSSFLKKLLKKPGADEPAKESDGSTDPNIKRRTHWTVSDFHPTRFVLKLLDRSPSKDKEKKVSSEVLGI